MEKKSETKSWLGSSIADICNGSNPWNFSTPPVSPSSYHHVLYHVPVNLQHVPKPYCKSKANLWDGDHVRMPFSTSNLFPVTENGIDVIKQRWDVIKLAYSKPIKTSRDLEKAIASYNKDLPELASLHCYFEEVLSEEERLQFFECVLPSIIKLALALPKLLPSGVPLLQKNHCRSVSLSQLQIGSLMANAFLCTFPWKKDVAGYYPGVNFIKLFNSNHFGRVTEKLKCICNYFRRITRKSPKGVITFERKCVTRNNMPRWDALENNLGSTKIHISSTGTIEDDGLGMLQVDFANKNVGGGVLGYGCVQEEIRFVICPELIISRLFVERLGDNEAVIVIGAERYSNYSGYGNTFTWAGDVQDETPFDNYGRRRTTISIIDATHFHKPEDQFYPSAILRELNKAYVGFSAREKHNLAPVATGNWGCGAFRGNSNLKSLIQLMACSATNRDLVYFSFGNDELKEQFYNMHLFLANHQITVTQLWRFLCKFGSTHLSPNELYSFIQQSYFDSKKQPVLKKFFTFKTKQENALPSTSKEESNEIKPKNCRIDINEIEVSDLDDIIPASQEDSVLVFKKQSNIKQRSLPAEILDKLPKNHNNLFEIIDEIDGNANASKEDSNVGDESLLSEIDKLGKKNKNVTPINSDSNIKEHMDIDEVIDLLPTIECSNVESTKPIKRKITDYFGTSSSKTS